MERESIHTEAERFGVEKPILEYQYRIGTDGTTIISLTEQSEKDWANYLRNITMSKLNR